MHHGACVFLLGINALRASEAAAVRPEDYQQTLRGHRVLHLVGKGSKPATHAADGAGDPLSWRLVADSGPRGRWC